LSAETPRVNFEKIDFVDIPTSKLRDLQSALHPLFCASGDLFWDFQYFMDRLDTEILRRTT
jgi:hypothetical protein